MSNPKPKRTRAYYIGRMLLLLGALPALGMLIIMLGGSPELAIIVMLGLTTFFLWFIALFLWVMDRLYHKDREGRKEPADE